MYTPYTFLFSSMVEKKQDVKGLLLNWPSYLIHHADSIKHFEFKNNKGEMLSQKFNHYPFYIDLIQSKSSHPLKFDFEIHQEQLFMCFMIAGDLEFWEPSLGKVNQAKEMYYYVTFNKPSIYNVRCAEGINTILVVNISPEWIETFCSNCVNLINMLKECLTGKDKIGLLPQCRMEKEVRKYLYEIQIASRKNTGILDGLLRMRIAQLLTYYDAQVIEKFGQLPYRIKDYLDTNFTDPTCDNRSIALNFHVTERTLRNNFKTEFNITPHNYLTALRMEQASKLYESGKSISEIYASIGYNDERSFRYKFKKYFEDNNKYILKNC